MRYKVPVFIVLLLQGYLAAGRQDCLISTVSRTGELLYNDAAIDSTLHLSAYRAFFVGESHTGDFEPRFKFCFIKQLHERYGVKDVFMEIGYAAAWFYNRYLETGDSSLLSNKQLIYMGGVYPEFWKKLYQYNSTFPDSLKITIHGIDFERAEIFKLLEAAKDKDVQLPVDLQPVLQHIHYLATGTALSWKDSRFEAELTGIRKAMQQYPEQFRILYGPNFERVYQAVMNTTPATNAVNPRNKAWRYNLEQTIKDKKIQRFVAFFGSAHTRYGNKTSLTSVFRQNPLFEDKVLHIATLYRHFKTPVINGSFVDYNPGEQELFEQFYNNNCRAVILPSKQLAGATYKSESDYVILASEIADP